MITSRTNILAGHKGLEKFINLYQEKQPNFFLDIIGKRESTTERYIHNAQFSGLGTAQLTQEGSVQWDEATTPYDQKVYPEIVALGVKWTWKAEFNDQYGIINRLKPELARGHYIFKEQYVANVINNSTSSSFLGADGKSLSATDHPTVSSTFSNRSTAETLSASALETMYTDLQGQLGYRDEPWFPSGSMNLIVPRQLGIRAKRILASLGQPGTANNDKNVIRETISYTVGNPFLTSATRYCLLPAGDENPIVLLQGMPMTVRQQMDIDGTCEKLLTVQEMATYWVKPQGTQFNEGA